MDVDTILSTMNRHGVRYLLIGGMNFMLRHKPILTYDIDLWIDDDGDNRRSCEAALVALDAEWGATESQWGPVQRLGHGWLDTQEVYCLNSPHGAIDIFREVRGLGMWKSSWENGVMASTSAGTTYRGLSDADMLRCQLALAEVEQKSERIKFFRGLGL